MSARPVRTRLRGRDRCRRVRVEATAVDREAATVDCRRERRVGGVDLHVRERHVDSTTVQPVALVVSRCYRRRQRRRVKRARRVQGHVLEDEAGEPPFGESGEKARTLDVSRRHVVDRAVPDERRPLVDGGRVRLDVGDIEPVDDERAGDPAHRDTVGHKYVNTHNENTPSTACSRPSRPPTGGLACVRQYDRIEAQVLDAAAVARLDGAVRHRHRLGRSTDCPPLGVLARLQTDRVAVRGVAGFSTRRPVSETSEE